MNKYLIVFCICSVICVIMLVQQISQVEECYFDCGHIYQSNPEAFENTNKCVCYGRGILGENIEVEIDKEIRVEIKK